MPISFNTIPAVIRTTGQYIEFDSSRAVQGLSAMPNVALIIGPRLVSVGSVASNVLASVASKEAAEVYWGHGSIIADMVDKFKAANPYTELWGIGVEVDAGGAAAAGSFAFTGTTATAAGEGVAYIAGERIAVSVAINDTPTVIGTALTAAIVAYCAAHNLPVVASGTATVTITALSKGVLGNDIDIRLNYNVGESLPTGIGCTVTAMTGGTLSPSIASAIAVMGAQWFNTVVCAFSDDTNLDLLEAELDDRWNPMVMQEGQCFIAAGGSQATLSALGKARNSKFTTLMGKGLSPTPSWVWAAVTAAVDCAEPDSARPRQTLQLTGCKPPVRGSEFIWLERNTLLGDGVSTYTVTPAGACLIERLVTTYQTGPGGSADTSYLNIETMRTLAYMRYSWRAWIAARYPRHKLADDGTLFGPDQAIVTPSILRSEGIAWFKEMINVGLAEGLDQFKTDALFERNSTDPDRADMRISPDLMNQFRVLAGQIQFLL